MTFLPNKKTLAGLVLGLSIAGSSLAASPAQAAQAATGTYVTQQGDTFWKVSRKLDIPLQQLLDMNASISRYNVYPGLTFKLPGAPVRAMAAESAKPLAAPASQEPTVTTQSGEQLAYSKQLKAVATAYTGSAAENGGWAGVDYFGNALKFGTIAVDPNMIPLGSKVYVNGHNYDGLPSGFVATASDIGGAIKDGRIDIYVPSYSKALAFGMQNVNLYVLK